MVSKSIPSQEELAIQASWHSLTLMTEGTRCPFSTFVFNDVIQVGEQTDCPDTIEIRRRKSKNASSIMSAKTSLVAKYK
jgi:hypothetical protein